MNYTFEATYDAEGAARAERTFYVRSVRELRPLSTFGAPMGLSLIVAVGLALGAQPWFIAFFTLFLALSVLGPVFFHVARPLAAKRYALKHPVRQITLTPESFQVAVGGRSANIAWGRVKHVWDAGEYVLLVLGKFGSVSIPKRSLPAGASDFINASVQNNSQEAGR